MSRPQEAFAGETAVVTGAGSGIGRATALLARGLGMDVVAADRDAKRLDALADDLDDGPGTFVTATLDVADPEAVEDLARDVFARQGHVRLLVNNAGVESAGLLWETPAAEVERVLRVNVLGVHNGIRAFVPRMLATGRPASIVNLASLGALMAHPYQGVYIASKHAVHAMSEVLALELMATGAPITVSSVVPGGVATRIFLDAPAFDTSGGGADAVLQGMQASVASGVEAEEVAERILAAAAAGDFWVVTHPEMTDAVTRHRASMLTELLAPAPVALPADPV